MVYMNILKVLYVVLGTLSLTLGIIGIIVPGLPTTPFLLLTAALYIKSSDKLYKRLISNKIVGPFILEYHQKKGVTWGIKFFAIGSMWIMIAISTLFFIPVFNVRLIVWIAGLIGTIVVAFVVPTVKNPDSGKD